MRRPDWRQRAFIGRGFRDRQWCDRIRAAMDQGDMSPAEICAEGFRIDEEARRAFDVEIALDHLDEVRRSINEIRPKVAQFFGVALSGDEGPGFLRYAVGGFYRRHRDVGPGWAEELPRRISVVVFLSSAGEECEGGLLRLYHPRPVDIAPYAGTLVAFPSDMLHEVLPVTSGVRDAVVDWFF
jgi:predicted 2-oxoglutarate/Fe(II)-dependent dioxygenase YbiX